MRRSAVRYYLNRIMGDRLHSSHESQNTMLNLSSCHWLHWFHFLSTIILLFYPNLLNGTMVY